MYDINIQMAERTTAAALPQLPGASTARDTPPVPQVQPVPVDVPMQRPPRRRVFAYRASEKGSAVTEKTIRLARPRMFALAVERSICCFILLDS